MDKRFWASLVIVFAAGAASGAGTVTISDNVNDEKDENGSDIVCFKIVTDNATYYYDKSGGGFTSIVSNGVDWIDYHQGGESQGEYRGIPNTGQLHPGYTGGTTTTSDALDTPLPKVTVNTTRNGWGATWEFFPTHAKMTLHTVPGGEEYYLLYEGTPGGGIDDSDQCYRSDNSSGISLGVDWTDDEIENTSGAAAGTEWVYFAASEMERSLFMIHAPDDDLHDGYWNMRNEMTVFGFGRGGTNTKELIGTGTVLIIGLVDSRDYDTIKAQIDAVCNGVSIDSFTASPATIAEGQSSTLSWSTSNATSASINQGVGTVNVNGSVSVSPTVTTTYTITVQGEGGPNSQQVTVTVADPAALHLKINCGGNTVAGWENDGAYATTGDLFTFSGTPDTSGVADAAPGEVYHTCRHNDPAYSFPAVPDGTYLVRIHFYDEFGGRSMKVDIEGQTRLTDYGFPTDTAVVEDIDGVEVSDGDGMQVVFSHTAGEDSFCSGIEIIAGGGTSTEPTISVVAPEAGSVWHVGTTQHIRWTSANVSQVSISYSTDGSSFAEIAGAVNAASGDLAWTVPDGPSTQCVIRIQDSGGGVSADSGVFEVRTVTDTDDDGMDDDWERAHFDDLSHDGTEDTDGDGTTDLDEFMAATDPTVSDGGGGGGGDGDSSDSGCGVSRQTGAPGAAAFLLALVLLGLGAARRLSRTSRSSGDSH